MDKKAHCFLVEKARGDSLCVQLHDTQTKLLLKRENIRLGRTAGVRNLNSDTTNIELGPSLQRPFAERCIVVAIRLTRSCTWNAPSHAFLFHYSARWHELSPSARHDLHQQFKHLFRGLLNEHARKFDLDPDRFIRTLLTREVAQTYPVLNSFLTQLTASIKLQDLEDVMKHVSSELRHEVQSELESSVHARLHEHIFGL